MSAGDREPSAASGSSELNDDVLSPESYHAVLVISPMELSENTVEVVERKGLGPPEANARDWLDAADQVASRPNQRPARSR